MLVLHNLFKCFCVIINMVYIATTKKSGKSYYYLVESISLGIGKRKQIRKYLGTEKPVGKNYSILVDRFLSEVEKEKKRLTGYTYLDRDTIKEVEDINKKFWKRYNSLNSVEKKQFDTSFLVAFVYNTNSIEGSTLTPKEVELLLEEGISPNKPINDVLEAKSAEKALQYIKDYKGKFNFDFVLKIHEIYFKDSFGSVAGKLKRRDNYVVGSRFQTTPAARVFEEMKFFFQDYNELKKKLHPLELAAWVHWKHVRIHPFQDGNGRTSRLLMNYVLHSNKYPMIDIKTKEKQVYFKTLDKCNQNNNALPLAVRLVRHLKKQYERALL